MGNARSRAPLNSRLRVEFRDEQGRILAADALSALLTATWEGPVRFGMTGPERSILYRLASDTGLSVEELRSLTPASFQLGESPTVTVVLGRAHGRRKQVLPLRPDTAQNLGSFLIIPEPYQPIFRVPRELAEMIRQDVQAATAVMDAADRDRRREPTGRQP